MLSVKDAAIRLTNAPAFIGGTPQQRERMAKALRTARGRQIRAMLASYGAGDYTRK